MLKQLLKFDANYYEALNEQLLNFDANYYEALKERLLKSNNQLKHVTKTPSPNTQVTKTPSTNTQLCIDKVPDKIIDDNIPHQDPQEPHTCTNMPKNHGDTSSREEPMKILRYNLDKAHLLKKHKNLSNKNTEDIAKLIQYWQKKGHTLDKKEEIPYLLHIKDLTLADLFKPIKRMDQEEPAWKETLRKHLERQQYGLAISFIERWSKEIKQIHNTTRVAEKIQPHLERLKNDRQDYEELINNFFKHRTNGFSPDSATCHTIDWCFKLKDMDGDRKYHLELTSRGDYNWHDKPVGPKSLRVQGGEEVRRQLVERAKQKGHSMVWR